MKKRILVISAILLIIAGISFLSYRLCCRVLFREKISKQTFSFQGLNLTREQKEKIAALNQTFGLSLLDLRKELAKERINLANYLSEPNPPQEKMDECIDKICLFQKEQQKKTVAYLLQIREVLTPEQQRKFFAGISYELCVGCQAETHTQDCYCGQHREIDYTK